MMRAITAHQFELLLIYCAAPFFIIATSAGENEENLGQKFAVTTMKNPLAGIPNTTTVQTGLVEYYLLTTLAEHLNFTYDIILPRDKLEAGTLSQNGWTGSMGLVERKEVDFCIALTSLDRDKHKVMDMSFPVIFDSTSIVIPFPQETNKPIALLFTAFQWNVWVCLIASITLAAILLYITHRVEVKNAGIRPYNLSYCFLLIIALMANHNFSIRGNSLSFRIVCGVVMIGTVVISIMYTAIFTSQLAAPNFKILVNSIEDVAADPKIQALVHKGSPTDDYFQKSPEKTIKMINAQLRMHPERKINVLAYKDISDVIKGEKVLIGSTSSSKSLVQQSFDKNNECRITLAEKPFYSRGQCVTYQKNSPITPVFEREILLMHQAGLLDYAKRRTESHNPCSLSESRKLATNETKMGFKEFMGAFVALGVGLFLSLIVFIGEIIHYRCMNNRNAAVVL